MPDLVVFNGLWSNEAEFALLLPEEQFCHNLQLMNETHSVLHSLYACCYTRSHGILAQVSHFFCSQLFFHIIFKVFVSLICTTLFRTQLSQWLTVRMIADRNRLGLT